MHSLVDLKERITHLEVKLQILPRRSQFIVVLQNVLVHAIERHRRRNARSANTALEAIGTCHGVVGQNSAITPPRHTQPIRIGHAHRDRLIHARQQILDFVVAPVRRNRLRIILPAPRAAAIVHVQLGIALRRQPLPQKIEAVLVLPIRPAVNKQNHRNRRSSLESLRLCQQPMNLRALFALQIRSLRSEPGSTQPSAHRCAWSACGARHSRAHRSPPDWHRR